MTRLYKIECATDGVHVDVGEVTTFDQYSLSEPAEKRPAGFSPNAGSIGVKGVPNSLNASILMYTGDQWSIIYVDQSSQSGQVAILQPQEKERAEN
ncbi:hypothetical protein NW757_008708 [Fusarium falciforme]|nr:hypothetical protein NW757_008708 [Fusarium falciforme]